MASVLAPLSASNFSSPFTLNTPRALRVLTLPDRLVLHDVTYALRAGKSATDRNVLVDAVNHVHSRAIKGAAANSPANSAELVDLSPAPRISRPASSRTSSPNNKHHYLVFPFTTSRLSRTTREAAYEAFSPVDAGIQGDANVLSVEAAAGFLGILRLHAGVFCVVASNIKKAGSLPSGDVLVITRVKLIKLSGGPILKEDREFATPIAKLLESGSLYYSADTDITRALEKRQASSSSEPNAFWWTYPMANNAGATAMTWSLRTVYGFVGSHLMRFASDSLTRGSGDFQYTLISRRSRRRAGTRYITRGVDALGDVANFVETEQVVWRASQPHIFSAFVIIRGSVPVFWRQNNGIARPSPELDSDLSASRSAFSSHFGTITKSYGEVAVVSLVDKSGSEGVLAYALERHFELDLQGVPAKLVAFDFHRHCAGKEYERGLAALLSRIRDDITNYGFYTKGLPANNRRQSGVFRVNCVDCLDRTNVVQSIIARVALSKQLSAIYSADVLVPLPDSSFRLYGDSEDRFKHVWGDNADAVSKQYSGTGALKTDFTRTGKRSTTGVIGDGVKSVMRMYYKNFVDESRQESIDLLCGNAFIHPVEKAPTSVNNSPAVSDSLIEDFFGGPPKPKPEPKPKSNPVWYKFQAQRMNAGGDRQDVVIELGDTEMYLSTPDGVRVEYPRLKLLSWSKSEDGKPSDRRLAIRLRLIFEPVASAPAAASPLDLIFKGGAIARETFLRAVLVWAAPAVIDDMGKKPIRLRCMAALNLGDHKIANWDLDGAKPPTREVLALVIPETFGSARSPGLAAVPDDVDSSNYSLVSAASTPHGGPALAILVSKDLTATVMSVTEAVCVRAPGSNEGSGVAVSMMVGGTSVCFASVAVDGAADLFRVVSSLKLRSSVFDITNQFHHICIAGPMGELKWKKGPGPKLLEGPGARKWVKLTDGSSVYSIANGLSVMRNSFPGLKWDDMLDTWSLWSSSTNPANGQPSFVATLSDGVTNGFPAPKVPTNMTQYVATLSKLKGRDIKTPPNVDSNTPLTTFVNIYSDFSSSEGLATRPTSRPTPNPIWPENIRVVFLPAEEDMILSSFLLGQVLIATPLSDTLVIGGFVIPMNIAEESGSEFNVPVRCAGITTGHIQGFLHIMPLNDGIDTGTSLVNNDSNSRPTSNLEMRFAAMSAAAEAPPRPAFVDNPAPFQHNVDRTENSENSQGAGSSAVMPVPGSYSSFMPTGLQQRITSAEVNDKLDAARKKSSKQIKSMVGRLSSLMNTAPSHAGSRARPRATDDTSRPRILDESPTWDHQL